MAQTPSAGDAEKERAGVGQVARRRPGDGTTWPIHPMGHLCLSTPLRDPREFPDRSFKYIDISSIDRGAKCIVNAESMLGAEAPSRARKEVEAGDVLVSTVRPNLNAVALVRSHLHGAIASTGFCVLRADPRVVEPRFLFFFCRTQEFVDALSRRVRGAHYPAVTDADVKDRPLAVPPLSEQRAILEILDQADRLRRLRAEADAKADRILPALFIKMFGDPATNPHGWNTGHLGDVIVETQYGTSKKASSDGGGAVVLRMNNISAAGRIDLTDTKRIALDKEELDRLALRPGDILFNRTNSAELVGKTGLWHRCAEPTVAASYLIRCRVDRAKVAPEYIWALMNTPFMKLALAAKARRAVGMANINATELRRLPGLFPPLDLQDAFVIRLRHLDELADRRIGLRESVERLFGLLLQRAFSGELTSCWREAHMNELVQEMEHQTKALAALTRAE